MCTITPYSWAEPPSPYGPEGKRFGLGLYVGEPTVWAHGRLCVMRCQVLFLKGLALLNKKGRGVATAFYLISRFNN
ncbi:MAG: hypothetical protein HYU97_06965 [Deltaproteobacteria bacterium]|nr:hypothetical protein [Deltaproteobacteria bacterium]